MRCVQPTPFFAIPFGFAKLEPAQPLNDELADLFRRRAAEGTRYANPRPLTQRNGQVFESEFQMFKWPEPCVRRLKEFCWQHLMQFIGQLNAYDNATLSSLGVTPGTYEWTWGVGQNQNFTLIAVPEPRVGLLLGVGFLLVVGVRLRQLRPGSGAA